MSDEVQQLLRNRLKKLGEDIPSTLRRVIPFYDDYLRLFNQRTDKIFEMITFILSQKDPNAPNSLRAGSLKCIEGFDGFKRIYLTSENPKSEIVLTKIYIKEQGFYIDLPSEELLISSSNLFDSFYSFSTGVDPFYSIIKSIEPIPKIIKDQKTPPPFTSHQLFDFEILDNKNILIKQSFSDRIVPFNIHSTETLFNPCLTTALCKTFSGKDYYSSFEIKSFFIFENSFEDHIQRSSQPTYHRHSSYRKDFDIGNRMNYLSFPVANFANFTRYLVDPRLSIILKTIEKPELNILNTLVSNLSSSMDDVNYNININSFDLEIKIGKFEKLKSKEIWRF